MNVLIYLTENNNIIKQPLTLVGLSYTCNLATRGFVVACYIDKKIELIPENFLSPLEAYYQKKPFFLNLSNLANDDFRGQNEIFTFSL